MKTFKVFGCDDYGRPERTLGIFYALDKKDARARAAKHFDNKEIVTTGFYGAGEISTSELESMEKLLKRQLKALVPIKTI